MGIPSEGVTVAVLRVHGRKTVAHIAVASSHGLVLLELGVRVREVCCRLLHFPQTVLQVLFQHLVYYLSLNRNQKMKTRSNGSKENLKCFFLIYVILLCLFLSSIIKLFFYHIQSKK